MARFPLGTTFRQGEYAKLLHKLAGDKVKIPADFTLAQTQPGNTRLIKSHTTEVKYPDGSTGTCAYRRQGPGQHDFRYTIQHGDSQVALAFLYHYNRLDNTYATIAAWAEKNAHSVYFSACLLEQRNYFARASDCKATGRVKRPDLYQMKGSQAKENGGKYALVDRITGKVLSPIYSKIDEINCYYKNTQEIYAKEGEELSASVGIMCCNRLDRMWAIPTYNPIYGEFPHLKRSEGDAY